MAIDTIAAIDTIDTIDTIAGIGCNTVGDGGTLFGEGEWF